MFVTFYSYKGGIGRSLALANIACLMAEDEEHPQRVLLWDFDLEAPGLHKLFPAQHPKRYGFVDMAYEYAVNKKVPDIKDFIYESEIEGIYILQAGEVDKIYCDKLQKINWLSFFGKDPKSAGPFFNELINSIKKMDKPFDYILVDSRTGLNDLAGICTQVIPDLLVILFRLTSQNYDGLQHLIPTIQSQIQRRDKKSINIIPVASQVGSAASRGISEFRPKIKKLFNKEIEYIRFDEELVSKEKLFARKCELESVWPKPYIVDDYIRICSIIRQSNKEDTKTATRELQSKIVRGDHATAFAILENLLLRRPRLSEAWKSLDSLSGVLPVKRKKNFQEIIKKIINEDKTNYFAYQWRARFFMSGATYPSSPKLKRAGNALKNALKFAPTEEKGGILQLIASIESCRGNHENAIRALKEALEVQPANNQLNLDLAMLHMRMSAKYFALASEELERVQSDVGDEKYITQVYLRSFLGERDKAEEALKNCSEDMRELVSCHKLLIEGNKKVALELAEKHIKSPGSSLDLANWIEVYLCSGELKKTLTFIGELQKERKGLPEEVIPLRQLARYLKKTNITKKDEEKVISIWQQECPGWNYRELVIFREKQKKEGINLESYDVIEKLIQSDELAKLNLQISPRRKLLITPLETNFEIRKKKK